jgi:GGDEF domain-containing protein
VTISLGAAIFPFHADSADDLLAHADTALYQAKRAGRNCVVIWSSTHPEIRVSPS